MQKFRPVIIGVGSLLGLAILLAIVGYLLPASYKVQRSVVIQAPMDTVFNTIHDLKNWGAWNPWSDEDAYFSVHYSEKTTGEGAWQHWTSQTMGNGMMRYTKVVPQEFIQYEMEFEMGDESTVGKFVFEEVNEGVQVTWVDEGSMGANPLQRYMGLFMESIIGSDFEKGLANIKQVCE